jgi:4-amino-4-deoxy-L-arabinose transferase-like glycosyltransferase
VIVSSRCKLRADNRARRLPRAHRRGWVLLGLGIVLVTSAALRLIWLGSIPAGLSHDETVKGYDAWSVLQTGRDQYGDWFPLVFRGIGDQREALLPYLIVLSEAVLGPTDLAVRLPTALAGIALVGVLFLLGRELFGTRAGLIAAALLAVSPWHIQVSRLAFRAGLLPLTTALGLWLFLVALRRPRLMLPAGLVLGLGLHTYLSARVFLPLLLVGVLVIYRDPLLRAADQGGRGWWGGIWTRPATQLLVGFGSMALPLAVWGLLHPAEFVGHAAESAGNGSPAWQVVDVLGRYLTYLGPRHLLTQGDPYPVPSTGRFGVLYWAVLPFAVIGLARLALRRRPGDLLVVWWLLIYPIPAALTRGAHPDWLRATCGIGVWELLSAVGAVAALDSATARWSASAVRVSVAALAALVIANAGWFLWDYSLRFPDRAAVAFNDGAAEAVRRLVEREPGYTRVVLPAGVPAVHDIYLFYARYDPRRLHREGLEDAAAPHDWADVRGFGAYRVCAPAECCGPGDLCLVRGVWAGSGDVLDEIRDRTGRVAFTIVAGR